MLYLDETTKNDQTMYVIISPLICQVSSRYTPNKALEAKKCYGTSSIEHPAVSMITTGKCKKYV